MYNKLVIGIDQSYTRTGIGLAVDNKLLMVKTIDYKNLSNNSAKRLLTQNTINKIITQNKHKVKEIIIIVERIRTFTGGDHSLRPAYIKTTAALIASIVDTAYLHNVKVYSVATISWKTQVLGTAKIQDRHKYEIKPEKMLAIEFIKKLGFDVYDRNNKGEIKYSVRGKHKSKIKYNDDACDSGCIALYGFILQKKQCLHLEE